MTNLQEASSLAGAPRYASLDGLRGVACLLVYFFHVGFNFRLGPVALIGSVGVHIFFVLSGFLMFGPFLPSLLGERPPPGLWKYAVRRATRIYPPFLVALIGFTAMRYVIGVKPPGAWNVAIHGLLVSNYVDPASYTEINGIFWTLAIEAQFYVLLPLVLLPLARYGKGRSAPTIAIGLFLGVGLAARYWESRAIADPDHVGIQSILAFLDMFGLGMAAAWIARRDGDRLARSPRVRWMLMVAGLTILLGASTWVDRRMDGRWDLGTVPLQKTFVAFGLCLGAAMIVLAAVTWPRGGPVVLTNRLIVWVGTISYSLYLYHLGTLYLTIRVVGYERLPGQPHYLNSFLMGLVGLPLALATAAVMYYAIEAPATRWGRRYSQHPEAIDDKNDNR